jgi:DNA invertase Pin-like site-specific DNA recombinase
MAEGKFVSYLRVSTARQGRSGLGLEAQRQAVTDWLDGGRWTLFKEFVEVESGKHADRPQLEKALQLCRLLGVKLVIAKLDRLSRDVHFLTGLEKAGISAANASTLCSSAAVVDTKPSRPASDRSGCSRRRMRPSVPV